MALFRIFYADGTSGVLAATDAAEARKRGAAGGTVTKVKLDRDRLGDTRRRARLTRKTLNAHEAPPCR